MEYPKYQNARDAAWMALIRNGVTSLPVKISEICRQSGIHVISYSKAAERIAEMGLAQNMLQNDGFSICIRSSGTLVKCIFFDDSCSMQRQRFTVAHEYGHFLCDQVSEGKATTRNKEPSERDNPIENQANVVASRLLAPACVLWALDVHDAGTVAKLCDISITSAEWRMKRLNLLYEREQDYLNTKGKSCFLMSELERRVYSQFEKYIKENKGL